MKMKKALCTVLALVLAIGMLAGCTSSLAETGADISAFVDNGEKLEIKWLSYHAYLAGCTEGTATELMLEDKFNIEIKPTFTDNGSKGYNDKKNALLQSGDIPDLVYELDPGYLQADARDEFLFEVPYEAIEKYAPSLYAAVNEKAPAAWSYSYYDGKNYGMPNMNQGHVTGKAVGYRGDWLEKVGMDIPETLDELHEVLYAFVHDDPDGNGKDDTYGYMNYTPSWEGYFGEIFGAYDVLPFDWQEVDGEIVYGGLRQEAEDVLAVLATWYKEGLIYPGFIEADQTIYQLMQSGKAGYQPNYGYEDPTVETTSTGVIISKFPGAKIVYGKPVKGPDGDFGFRSWGDPCHAIAFGANGEDTPVKVTRLLSMFETIYNDTDLLIEARLGKEGVTYNWDKESKSASSYKATEEYKEASKRRLEGYEFAFSGPTYWTPFAPKDEVYEMGLSDGYKTWMAQYLDPESNIVDVFYKPDIVPSAPTYIQDLRNQQMALMSQIIKGEKPADQYIEEFTKIWEGTGGPVLLEEAKQQQSIIDEIYAKIGIEK